MADLDMNKVRKAWRSAAPADLVWALNSPDDLPPEVFAIVQAEADRRGLHADSDEALPPPTFERPRRAAVRLGRLASFIAGHARRHPFVAGLILGLLLPLGDMGLYRITPGLWRIHWIVFIISIAMYIGGLLAVCWPMLSYRTVAASTFAGGLGLAAVSFADLCLVYIGTYAPPFKLTWFLYAGPANLAGAFLVFFLLLAAIVYIRNRYWPVYEPGRCRVCEYDLRGLPEPRCPECGTPFDPTEAINLLSPP